MQTRRFGPLPPSVSVPVIGLGTWRMEAGDRHDAIRAIRRAIELGMTHIDTAEMYGKGAVEQLVGEAIAGYRADVFLASKVHPDHATYAGTLLACEKSLRRLRTDRLDLYMIHWRGTLPLEETFRALETLKQDGKILAWGVSNFDVNDLEEAIGIVGEGVIACDQVLYNLAERDAEHALHDFCQQHDIAFVAYSPLLAGDFPRPGTPRGDTLGTIAAAHGVTPHAVALAYVTRLHGSFAIPKSTSVEHLGELARAGELLLLESDLRAIDTVFPLSPPRPPL